MTHGLVVSPRSTAFFASRPAPIKTEGFDVFVHDVIAATTTAPLLISTSVPSIFVATESRGFRLYHEARYTTRSSRRLRTRNEHL